MKVPNEIAFLLPVSDAVTGSAPTEHDFVGKIRIECGIVDLADHRRELGNAQTGRQFMVQASRYLDFEAARHPLDDLQRVPSGRPELVHIDLGVAEILESPLLFRRAIGQIPMGDATGQYRRPHDLERLSLADLALQIEIDPER